MALNISQWIEDLGFADPKLVGKARSELLRLGPDVIPILESRYLLAGDELHRIHLLSTLGELAEKGRRAGGSLGGLILERLPSMQSAHERATTLRVIGQIGGRTEAKLVLLRALDAPDEREVANAIEGLHALAGRFPEIGEELIPILRPLVSSSILRVRINAMRLLHLIHDTQRKALEQSLRWMSEHGEESEKSGAAYALRSMRG